MVIDTSALIAILSDEPEAPGLEAAIEADSVRLLSAASLAEASIVIESRYGEAGGRELDLLVREADIPPGASEHVTGSIPPGASEYVTGTIHRARYCLGAPPSAPGRNRATTRPPSRRKQPPTARNSPDLRRMLFSQAVTCSWTPYFHDAYQGSGAGGTIGSGGSVSWRRK